MFRKIHEFYEKNKYLSKSHKGQVSIKSQIRKNDTSFNERQKTNHPMKNKHLLLSHFNELYLAFHAEDKKREQHKRVTNACSKQ